MDALATRLHVRKYPNQTIGKECIRMLLHAAIGYGEADLIALAIRGRGALSRLLLGSVADKIVLQSSVPVLICRSDYLEWPGLTNSLF